MQLARVTGGHVEHLQAGARDILTIRGVAFEVDEALGEALIKDKTGRFVEADGDAIAHAIAHQERLAKALTHDQRQRAIHATVAAVHAPKEAAPVAVASKSKRGEA